MKLLVFISSLVLSIASFAASNYECKLVANGEMSKKQVCFSIGHKCVDPHGIGDGKPVEIDCWNEGSRGCYNGSANWPECAGGIVANECKEIEIDSVKHSACFPIGHTCYDYHGIGDGVPIKIDCWEGGSRSCYKGSSRWPTCAGGFLKF